LVRKFRLKSFLRKLLGNLFFLIVPALFFYNRGSINDQAVGALSKEEIERRLNAMIL